MKILNSFLVNIIRITIAESQNIGFELLVNNCKSRDTKFNKLFSL